MFHVLCDRFEARPAYMPPGWCLQPLEIHETVAECMIFANHCVAKRVYEAFPSAALVSVSSHRTAYSTAWPSQPTPSHCHGYHFLQLRRHPAPEADHFSQLLKCAAAKQFSISVRSAVVGGHGVGGTVSQ